MTDTGAITPADDTGGPQFVVDHLTKCWAAEEEWARKLETREALILSAIAVLLGIGLYQMDWFHDQDESLPYWWLRLPVKGLLILAMCAYTIAFCRILGWRIRRLKIIESMIGHLRIRFHNACLRCSEAMLRLHRRRWSKAALRRQSGRTYRQNFYLLCKQFVANHERRRLAGMEAVDGDDPIAEHSRSAQLLALSPEDLEEAKAGVKFAQTIIMQKLVDAHGELVERNDSKARKIQEGEEMFFVGLFLTMASILIYILSIAEVGSAKI